MYPGNKDFTVAYVLSLNNAVYPLPTRAFQKTFFFLENKLLTEDNNLLVGCKHAFLLSNVQVDFSFKRISWQLNGFFTSSKVKETIVGNSFITIDMAFSFLAASFIDSAIGYIANSVLAMSRATYSDIANHVLYGSTGLTDSSASGFYLIQKLKYYHARKKINPWPTLRHQLVRYEV